MDGSLISDDFYVWIYLLAHLRVSLASLGTEYQSDYSVNSAVTANCVLYYSQKNIRYSVITQQSLRKEGKCGEVSRG